MLLILQINVFQKHVSKNKNHGPALVYYAIDNRMYYVDRNAKNEDGSSVVQSLIQKALAAETLHKTVMFKHDDVKTEKIIILYLFMKIFQLPNY